MNEIIGENRQQKQGKKFAADRIKRNNKHNVKASNFGLKHLLVLLISRLIIISVLQKL
jgi:hypothetical protein